MCLLIFSGSYLYMVHSFMWSYKYSAFLQGAEGATLLSIRLVA